MVKILNEVLLSIFMSLVAVIIILFLIATISYILCIIEHIKNKFMEKKNNPICSICRYCEITSVANTPACILTCKFHKRTDPITGFDHYPDCNDYNSNGECTNWERGGIVGFIQRLIKHV